MQAGPSQPAKHLIILVIAYNLQGKTLLKTVTSLLMMKKFYHLPHLQSPSLHTPCSPHWQSSSSFFLSDSTFSSFSHPSPVDPGSQSQMIVSNPSEPICCKHSPLLPQTLSRHSKLVKLHRGPNHPPSQMHRLPLSLPCKHSSPGHSCRPPTSRHPSLQQAGPSASSRAIDKTISWSKFSSLCS